jgi:hypothetical protein
MALDFARGKLTSLLENGTSRQALIQDPEGSRAWVARLVGTVSAGRNFGRMESATIFEALATAERCGVSFSIWLFE